MAQYVSDLVTERAFQIYCSYINGLTPFPNEDLEGIAETAFDAAMAFEIVAIQASKKEKQLQEGLVSVSRPVLPVIKGKKDANG